MENAGGLTTALKLQRPSVNNLHGQAVQMVLTLKITLLYQKQYSGLEHEWIQVNAEV
jgi:hypothetical protein